MKTEMQKARAHFPLEGYSGILIVLAAEALLFAGNELVGRWFTPIVWTGYILFTDALVHRFTGRSLLKTERLELLIIAVVSIAAWWLFEFYNAPRFWRSDLELWWHYHNLEPNPYLRRVGYDWAFATIFPAMFLTAELFRATLLSRMSGGASNDDGARSKGRAGSVRDNKRSERRPLRLSRRALKLSRPALYLLIAVGAAAALLPLLIISQWLVPLVWLSFILLLDPLNALRGWPSITGDAARGDYRRVAALLLGGGVCGLLWEFWNYWAISKWTYTVPYLGHVKLFEMPVLGFLGFPPFAVECWAIYIFCRSLLGTRPADELDQNPRIWFLA